MKIAARLLGIFLVIGCIFSLVNSSAFAELQSGKEKFGSEKNGQWSSLSEPSSEYVDFCCYSSEWYAALKSDGTVIASGLDRSFSLEDIDEINSWENIVDIVSCGDMIVGLKEDGTVEEIGLSNLAEYYTVTSPDSWTDITKICIGYTHTIYGLKADGTVAVAGYMPEASDEYTQKQRNNIATWENVVDLDGTIYMAGDELIALCADGRVLDRDSYENLSEEQLEHTQYFGRPVKINDGISIQSGGWINTCLRADGTVAIWGYDYDRLHKEVSQWTDVVQVYGGDTAVIALKSDGTVLRTHALLDEYHAALDSWTDITYLYHSDYDGGYTFGVKNDGTVVLNWGWEWEYKDDPDGYYYSIFKEIQDTVQSWKNIETIEMEYGAVIGHLRGGGIVVCAPEYKDLISE